jgi:mutual gliding-motility protein MglA
MPTIDFATGEVRLRFAALGPLRSGKSSLLRRLHAIVPPETRGEISMRLAGDDEIISFDFTPAELIPTGKNHAAATLFAFTGGNAGAVTLSRQLADLDAVLFVADSQPDRLGDNVSAFRQLTQLRALADVPVVLLYNKRDLPDATPLEQLQAALNPVGAMHIEASTATGKGCDGVLGALVAAAFAAG